MPRSRPLVLVVACALPALTGACGGGEAGDADELVVLAAASLTDAFGELGEVFEDQRGVAVTFSFGGSSSLREQILEGSPADVFASASPGPMADLVEAGAVGDPVTFATNRLQIVVPAGNPGGVRDLGDLARDELLVGRCAPEVPCGEVARRVLEEAGVDAAPDTEEPDVRALLVKVAEGELDAGLVYVTDVRSAGDRVEGIDLDEAGATTDYQMAVVAGSARSGLASEFVSLVRSRRGQQVLQSYGFSEP
ncbi:MAG TPA: molybdate ABC transporter substrate-binding protein [Acidimicrobiales bacterium]|nr:molybdate ABC transporter substrate-binding protein [Acidimicrobiales bacterium]